MPRPHYPATGGPHLPSWNTSEARKRHRPSVATPYAAPEPQAGPFPSLPIHKPTPASLASHSEMSDDRARTSRPDPPPALPNMPDCLQSQNRLSASAGMMWIAALLTCLALLFTILVILYHG